MEEAIFLSHFCKKVCVVHSRDEFRAAKVVSTKLLNTEKITVLWDQIVEEITGNQFVKGLKITNVKTKEDSTIEVDGVFVAVGTLPNSETYRELVLCDESGYLIADETCETNISGVFVAGDVRKKQLRQVVTAASDGANAITSVERYLNHL